MMCANWQGNLIIKQTNGNVNNTGPLKIASSFVGESNGNPSLHALLHQEHALARRLFVIVINRHGCIL